MSDAIHSYSSLTMLPGRFAITRIDPAAPVPEWAWSGQFVSISRTPTELSIVCDETAVPLDLESHRGWRAFVVAGPVDLSTVGVLASITQPIARAGIALFTVSTFETDYLLVHEDSAKFAAEVLRGSGHDVMD